MINSEDRNIWFMIPFIGFSILISGLILTTSHKAQATADYDGPVVVSYTFSPTTIDISSSPATVVVTARVTDVSGVASAPIVYIQNSDNPTATQQTGWLTRTSGTAQDGIYTATITIPAGLQPGQWSVFSNMFYDVHRNSSVWPVEPDNDQRLTVTNQFANDYEGPAVVSYTFSPTTIDISSSPATVVVTARVTDVSGVASAPIVYIQSSDNPVATQQTGWLTRTSGTAQDGIYTATINIPCGLQPGQWSVFSNMFYDVHRNSSVWPVEPDNDQRLTVTNFGSRDLCGPHVSSFEFFPTSVDVSKSAATLNFALSVSDPDGVVDFGSIHVYLQNQQIETQKSAKLRRDSGDSQKGFYSATITIPCGALPGKWGVTVDSFVDSRGNSSSSFVYPLVGRTFDVISDAGLCPIPPIRVLNTRETGKIGSVIGTAEPTTFNVYGKGGLPSSGISAVVLNVTVVSPEVGNEGGFLTVYPCASGRPDASNLNFVNNQTIPNTVIAPVDTNGNICFYSYGKTHVLADVAGYFPSGSSLKTLSPSRILNTRSTAKGGNLDGTAEPLTFNVYGKGGLPTSGISAVLLNVTAVDPEVNGSGFLTVYPCASGRPDASNLNFVNNQTIPNTVIAPVDTNGNICFYSYGKTHVLADVAGYFP
jgi:hypothetical protein